MSWRELGTADGKVAGTDPTGRFVAMRYKRGVMVLDASLATVFSTGRVPGRRVHVHPDGNSFVCPSERGLHLYRRGRKSRRTDCTQGRYTVAGELVGLAYGGERMRLLDGSTLATLAESRPLVVEAPIETLEEPVLASGPRSVALAASQVDTLEVLVSATVDGTKLEVEDETHMRALELSDRALDLAVRDDGKLIVTSSNGIVSVLGEKAMLSTAKMSPKPVGMVSGAVSARGHLLATLSELRHGEAWSLWTPYAVVVADPRTLRPVRVEPLPVDGAVLLAGGLVAHVGARSTRFWRWAA